MPKEDKYLRDERITVVDTIILVFLVLLSVYVLTGGLLTEV